MSKNTNFEYFTQAKLPEIYEQLVTGTLQESAVHNIHGPKNKTIATIFFERIIVPILIDDCLHSVSDDNYVPKISYNKDTNGELVININDTNFATTVRLYDGTVEKIDDTQTVFGIIILPTNNIKISLQKLLNLTDFTHLALNKEDVEAYSITLPSFSSYYKDILLQNNDPTDQYALKKLPPICLKAINDYTGGSFETINSIMRAPNETGSETFHEISQSLLTVAFSAWGLSKIHVGEVINTDTKLLTPTYVVRNEKLDTHRLEYLKNCVQEHKITKDNSFYSCSLNDVFFSATHPVKLIFKLDGAGQVVYPISRHPEEQEVLVLPSQTLRWIGFKEDMGKTIFTAELIHIPSDDNTFDTSFIISPSITHTQTDADLVEYTAKYNHEYEINQNKETILANNSQPQQTTNQFSSLQPSHNYYYSSGDDENYDDYFLQGLATDILDN